MNPLHPSDRPGFWSLAFVALALHGAAAASATVELPKSGLEPAELAVIINEADPLSVRIGEYYQQRRGIPAENVIRVSFPPKSANLPRDAFKTIHETVLGRSGPGIQAYALAWALPYKVDCMSITSAFAFGFNEAFCSARQCAPTKPSGYS